MVLRSETDEMIEVPWEEGARLVDQCTHLFATDIREIEELTLCLKIVEAKAQGSITASDSVGPLAELKIGAKPIEQDETCNQFQLVFGRKHMISYTVSNESYGKYPESPETFTGKLFRIFSHSHLLEFTKQTTYASDEHPGILMHFEIACLNHVIDVICTAPPAFMIRKQKTISPRLN
jgi:hypothetical protein